MIAPTVAVLCVLALWELVVGIGLLNENHVPSMTNTVSELTGLLTDGDFWSAVGSTNFDDRAFEINDEITLGIVGKEFAKKMEAVFERDAKACKEVDAKEWEKRPWKARAQEHFYYLWNEML